ncbi:hypothetical protein E2C01_000118 [Portunus trituberculatus]|uniref:Uncharacterized protein n=1 Tax=Portunus trituberculatus TaxID=210409 RepID=A0A5B7CFH0_PORTR|nr:hypothetical protein [Portunus trituberculatus]
MYVKPRCPGDDRWRGMSQLNPLLPLTDTTRELTTSDEGVDGGGGEFGTGAGKPGCEAQQLVFVSWRIFLQRQVCEVIKVQYWDTF